MKRLSARFLFNRSRAIFPKLVSIRPKIPKRHFLMVFVALLISGLGYFTYGYFDSPRPTITITSPAYGEAVFGEKLFVKGSVSPANASVVVNDKQVALNGDGSFTVITNIPLGESILSIKATNRGKKASLQHIVKRDLSEEEEMKKKKEQELADLKAKQEVINTDQRIEEILGAYTANVEPKSVKILSHEVKEQAGFKRIIGDVLNGVTEPVYWVKITATFFDKTDNPVDTKVGFAVQFEKSIGPFEIAKFETASTSKEFSYYKLSVDWKKESDLSSNPTPEEGQGEVSESSPVPEPSPSPEAQAE